MIQYRIPPLVLLFVLFSYISVYSQCPNDTSPPTAICKNITVNLSSTGIATIPATMVDNGSFDNCGIATYLINGLPNAVFHCGNVGQQTVVLIVTDHAGNIDSCTATITVVDQVAPTAICKNFTLDLSSNGQASLYPVDIDNGSFDNCSIATYLINGKAIDTFDCSDIGQQMVTLSIIDQAGNMDSCTATLTVLDNTPPMASCKTFSVQLSPLGLAVVTPPMIDNGSSDNCGIVSYLINGQAMDTFSCSDIGPQSAILTVVDASGNTSSCTTIITVLDTIAPTIQCRATVNIPIDSTGLAAVTFNQTILSASDNCSAINWGTVQYLNCSHLGSPQVVSMTATDMSGNQTTCNTTVYVTDFIPPTVSCQNQTIYLSATGVAILTPSQVSPNSTDQCGIYQEMLNGQPSLTFSSSDIGTHSVAYTAIDSTYNSSQCVALVTVIDSIPPNANCQANVTIPLDATGHATVHPSAINLGSTDNVGIHQILLNGQSSLNYTCQHLGNHQVTLSIIDSSGNSSTCIATINITDPFSSCSITSIRAIDSRLDYTIYPNPTQQYLNITTAQSPIQQISLQTLTGKTILDKTMKSTYQYQLDLKDFPKTIYILNIRTQDSWHSQKIILQE